MEFTEDKQTLKEWVPLVMDGRPTDDIVAATRMITGADVELWRADPQSHRLSANAQRLCRSLFASGHRHRGANRMAAGASMRSTPPTTRRWRSTAKFVFIGAGGGALPLLQKSGIPEANGYAGFPVSGIWLRCDDPAINKRHHAKVYGKADVGSPPMSVPHLDTRVIGDKHSLLFGPYAGFSTKFLKHGSLLDLFRLIRLGNILPIMEVGLHNFDLDEYLVEQVVQSPKDRFATLTAYYPLAQQKDWKLQQAGMRVQTIKRDPTQGRHPEIRHRDRGRGRSLPGGAARRLAGRLDRRFGHDQSDRTVLRQGIERGGWKTKLQEMIPSYGHSLIDDAALTRQVRADTAAVLGAAKRLTRFIPQRGARRRSDRRCGRSVRPCDRT